MNTSSSPGRSGASRTSGSQNPASSSERSISGGLRKRSVESDTRDSPVRSNR